jgi:hypothetical protein
MHEEIIISNTFAVLGVQALRLLSVNLHFTDFVYHNHQEYSDDEQQDT